MQSAKKILIASERPEERTEIAEQISLAGYRVSTASCAQEATDMVRNWQPDLILAHLDGRQDPGWTLLRAFADAFPVVAVASGASMDEKIRAFELGADEFLDLPMWPQELGLRIGKALGRWSGARASGDLTFDRCHLNVAKKTVTLDGRTRANLTASEFGALKLLLENAGRHVSRSEISTLVLRKPYVPESRAVDMLVSKLRSKTRTHKGENFITSVRGAGYSVNIQMLGNGAQRVATRMN